jgi:predicted nucleotidyltransferase component of viral defense system
MKTSTQLKALIRNFSKNKNVETEVVLRSFMLERLLERIANSRYRNIFILKGGMLIAAIVGINARTTLDMDISIKGLTLTMSMITEIFNNILNTTSEDNAIFSLNGVEEICEVADYPGYRISIEAVLDKTRQVLKIDVTTGDSITPNEVEYDFKLMFEDRSISILSYNLETIIAEKFETIITRGITNTRMRDFYDIYILTTTQIKNININTLHTALKNTTQKRHSKTTFINNENIINTIENSNILITSWQRYREKYSYATNITWEMIINALKNIALNYQPF